MSDVKMDPPAPSEPTDFDPPVPGAIFDWLIGIGLFSFAAQTFVPDHIVRSLEAAVGSTVVFHTFFWFTQFLAVVLAHWATLLSLRQRARCVWRMFERARDRGTSWFPDVKSDGHCQMNKVGEKRQGAVQHISNHRSAWICVLLAALFGGAFVIYLAVNGFIALSSAMWGLSNCVVTALVAVATLRRISKEFSSVPPTDAEIESATGLHLKSIKEQKDELVSIARRG